MEKLGWNFCQRENSGSQNVETLEKKFSVGAIVRIDDVLSFPNLNPSSVNQLLELKARSLTDIGYYQH